MFDRRFPYLFRPSDLPHGTPEERARFAEFASRVRARTDFEVTYNAKSGRLFYYIGDPTQGGALPNELTRFATGPRSYDLSIFDKVDEVCSVLQSGRMSMAAKDRLHAHAEKSKQSDREAAMSRFVRPELLRLAREELTRNKLRFGMSGRFRPSVLVNGLKGGTD